MRLWKMAAAVVSGAGRGDRRLAGLEPGARRAHRDGWADLGPTYGYQRVPAPTDTAKPEDADGERAPTGM